MRAVDVIIKKREGRRLGREEIETFLRGYLSGEIADYQASALLMAIFLRGMDFEETATLTEGMMRSGDIYDLSHLGLGRTVDKHSTGGVGDKVSLILAPLVAVCGVAVPMVSGRGLGHTGGTLDKLESIPGFRVNLTREEFYAQLQTLGVAMIGQSGDFVPADKRLYALRDVTGTVESIPLICASILSKKVASGAEALVMDVKVGSGAFMPTVERARDLAQGLIGVGEALGRPVRALITDMHQPLGVAIGNAIEVRECIDCLHGRGPDDLRTLTLELAADMLVLGEKADSRDEALMIARQALDDGEAWRRFLEMVQAQGGDVRVLEDPERLEISDAIDIIQSPSTGIVASMNCREIGNAASILGAGRARATDTIDPGVGLEMKVRLGQRVEQGEPLLAVRHRNGRGLEDAHRRLAASFLITEEDSPSAPPLIHERIA